MIRHYKCFPQTIYCHYVKTFLDREGWVVGVVVTVISIIVQASWWDNLQNVRMICSEELYEGASARLPRQTKITFSSQ